MTKCVYWQQVLFTVGFCSTIIADVWAVLVDQVFRCQYSFGFWFLVPFAGAILTASCFGCRSARRLIWVSAIELGSAIFLIALYAETFYLYQTDVFGTDAYLLVSGYIWIVWIPVSWIMGFLGKKPKPEDEQQ